MTSRKKNNKITNINSGVTPDRLGVFIFSIILIYMVICIVSYINTKHVVGYEVVEGSLSQNNIYRGIALRNEQVVNNEVAGPVYYFATEDRHVAKGDLVYVVDESDSLAESSTFSDQASTISLTDDDYSEIQDSIKNYMGSFSPTSFSSVYDFKNSISGTVSKLVNSTYLSSIGDLNEGSNAFSYQYAPASGVVVYSKDGYEDLTLQDMTPDLFDETKYEQTVFASQDLVSAKSPVYKLSTDEDWSVVIQVDSQDTADALVKEGYIEVRFLKNQLTAWASVSSYTDKDGNAFVQLSFTNSMITFATDRFLSIELITEQNTGLKIPKTSIIEKEFYVVDTDYINENSEGNYGVSRKTTLEDGSSSTEFVETEIYAKVPDTDADGNELSTAKYYIDTSALQSGDTLVNPANGEEMNVGETAKLKGVYNINKGYADFSVINVLYENDTYAIVESNTNYGLRVYDYIVLDATTVSNDELVNQ